MGWPQLHLNSAEEVLKTNKAQSIDPEVAQRKSVEAQVQAQAANPLVVGQMASTSDTKEMLPLQKKQ